MELLRGEPILVNAGFVVLLNDFLCVHELLLCDAVSLHELFSLMVMVRNHFEAMEAMVRAMIWEVFNIG